MDLGHLPVRASEINTQASTSAIHSLRFRKRTQSSLVSEYMFIAGNLKNREKPKTEVTCALGRLLKRGRQRGLFLQHRGLRQCGARGGGSSGSPPGLAPAPSSPPPSPRAAGRHLPVLQLLLLPDATPASQNEDEGQVHLCAQLVFLCIRPPDTSGSAHDECRSVSGLPVASPGGLPGRWHERAISLHAECAHSLHF